MSEATTNGGGVYDSISYHPRLCHLLKWDDFNGYGFNLHAEKGKAGQYIGKVDEGSPAVAANLRQGDRIVEVNGVNIGNENHQQVVQRIKAGGDETKLLVVDAETDLYFKEKKIVVRGEMEEVIYCKTPPTSADISTEGPVHVNSNHTETETLNHNEETGEEIKKVEEESKDVVDAGPVVVNGVTEELPPPPVEAVPEPVENGIYETVVTQTEVIEVTPEPVAAPPEPEAEVVVAEPEPVVAVPEPEAPVAEVIATEVVTTEVTSTEVVTTEVVTSEVITEPAAPEPEPIPEPEPEPVAVVPEPEPEPVVVAPVPEPVAESPKAPASKKDDPLDFGNVSVEEMKKRIQSKKKVDTRFSQMSIREKHDLLQRL